MAVTKLIVTYPSAGVDQGIYARWVSMTTGRVWNGSAMVAIVEANVATYGVVATFLGLDNYRHTVPSSLQQDSYRVESYLTTGGVQTANDIKLPEVLEFAWDEITLSAWESGSSFIVNYLSGGVDQGVYARWVSLTTGNIWNGSAMVAIVEANVATYGVGATFLGLDNYLNTAPVLLPADSYRAENYLKTGGVQTANDIKLPETRMFSWDGAELTPWMPTTGTTVTGATSVYADTADLEDFYGVSNITIYSDLENAGTRDSARIQVWLTRADDWINLAFKRAGRTTPIADTEDDFTALTMIAAEWAGAMLAKGRGDLPAGFSSRDGFDSFMDGHIERAEKRLAELVSAWLEANPEDDAEITEAVQAIVPAREQDCWWWR
jgi:hypothetical protein